jgi:hypothetical protein
MLTSDLIGPTWSIKYQANAKSTKCKFIEDQVIKTQVKGIKLKNHVPRHMRSKS